MLRILTLEDDAESNTLLVGFIDRYMKENDLPYTVSSFTNGLSLLDDYAGADLLFLDIDMPAINGMEVAKRLRLVDANVIIVFVTNLAQYAIQGYEVNAFDYILKPVNYYDFLLKLNRVVEKIGHDQERSLLFSNKDGSKKIRIADILYIEVIRHNLVFHLKNEPNYQCYGPLWKIEERLKGDSFSLCNQCYLVNLRYVVEVKDFSAKLIDGESLQVSHPRKQEFLKDLNLYLNNSGDIHV